MHRYITPTLWLFGFSSVAMVAFVYLFILRNAPGLTDLPWIIFLGASYCLLYAFCAPLILGSITRRLPVWLARLLYLATLVALPLLFLSGTVWDYYQPLSLFDDVIAALALAWLLLLLALILALVAGDARFVLAAAMALLGPAVLGLVASITDPQPAAQLEQHQDLFIGGQDGYDIYRIPALLVLPVGMPLADGGVLARERLLAFAEARRDGALDTGAIDLVLKHSDDGGANWSAQRVVCTHEVGEARGKCGNATPVFDADTGVVWLAYNLSGIPGDLPEGPRPHSAHLKRSEDGGLHWGEAIDLPFSNIVFGPGHGLQKKTAPRVGRLVLPGYRSSGSLALYSDDQGASWQAGAELGYGNEAEIAELADGRLYMATRHNAPIGRPPEPLGRLYALSADGGESWPEQGLDQALPTPVCQASVVARSSGALVFANPAHGRSRVSMTVRESVDGGDSWARQLEVYPGPSGYSQLGVLAGGQLALLYERGRMAYSERISFARLPRDLPVSEHLLP